MYYNIRVENNKRRRDMSTERINLIVGGVRRDGLAMKRQAVAAASLYDWCK